MGCLVSVEIPWRRQQCQAAHLPRPLLGKGKRQKPTHAIADYRDRAAERLYGSVQGAQAPNRSYSCSTRIA